MLRKTSAKVNEKRSRTGSITLREPFYRYTLVVFFVLAQTGSELHDAAR